ncbi:MAG: peroxiredoxin family protein, partial [Candidatus Bathyarchaeia archaeon]
MSQACSLDYLTAYYRGINYSLAALRNRIAELENPTKDETLATVDRYRTMILEYIRALKIDVKKTGNQRDNPTPALRLGDEAPDFSLMGTDQKYHTLHDYIGKKRVLINFFRGDWCPYCNGELMNLAEEYPEISKSDTEILAISVDPVERNKALAAKLKLPFHVLSDEDSRVMRRYGVYDEKNEIAFPSTFLVSKSGATEFIRA